MPVVTLPDGSRKQFDQPVTVADVAAGIGAGLAKAALAGRVNGTLVDTAFEITEDAVNEVATIAAEVNESVENIGARRLQTVMEKLLEDISFEAEEHEGETVKIDAAYVRDRLGELAGDADLSKYIL